MSATLVTCGSCGANAVPAGTICPACGKPTGGGEGAGFLPLIAWLFIPLAIPVYPVLGSIGTLTMLAAHGLGSVIGLSDGFRLIGIAVAGYAGIFFGLRLERSLSRGATYRTLRKALRVLLMVAFAGGALFGSGKDLSPGAALMIVVIGLPLLIFVTRRFDRVLGVRGPDDEPSSP